MALSDIAIRGFGQQKALQGLRRDGLFLLVNPTGPKLWRYCFDGKEKLMALTSFPAMQCVSLRTW
jgi:hypothetical protein